MTSNELLLSLFLKKQTNKQTNRSPFWIGLSVTSFPSDFLPSSPSLLLFFEFFSSLSVSEKQVRLMSRFNESELAKLKLLKVRVKDAMQALPADCTTDSEMVRWLQARSWNIDKAEAMFRKNIEWKKSFGLDDLVLGEPNKVH